MWTCNNSVNILLFAIISVLVTFSATTPSIRHNHEAFTERCRSAAPIESNYTATGTFFELNNMTVYETLNKTSKKILIAAYDIFGLHNNTKQFVDKLADGFGFKIAMPDYFRGPAWDENNFPPENQQDLLDWVALVGNWSITVKTDTLALIDYYRTRENVTEFGIFGFCWGGYVSTQSAIEIPQIKAAGLVHPSLVYDDEAELVQAPMYLLPALNDPNMLQFYLVLQRKFGSNCGHRRYDDMLHGFASGRANFTDPLNRMRVDEVIDILGNFFGRNLNGTTNA